MPDDIAYDAFKLEFERATVNNPERKNRSRLGQEERANIMHYLSLPRERYLREYRALPNLDSKRKTSYLYAKATNHFHIGGPQSWHQSNTEMPRPLILSLHALFPLRIVELLWLMGSTMKSKIPVSAFFKLTVTRPGMKYSDSTTASTVRG